MFTRRDFLQALAATTAGIMLPACSDTRTSPLQVRGTSSDKLGPLLPQRRFGRTGQAVTMLGLGGAHVGDIGRKLGESAAQETIEVALEGGVRFFDNAESYNDGNAERLYGKYLIPKYRDHIFLQTKSYVPNPTDPAKTREHLEGSLKRLNTDHLDLWLVHSIQNKKDAEARVTSGVVDFYVEAKQKGLAKHIGFSGHFDPEANNHFIELLAQRGDPLETCQMPINVLDPNYASFILNTVPKLQERNYGICAMKTLAGGGFFRKPEFLQSQPHWKAIVPDRVTLADAMHFVWSLPVAVAVSGPDNPQQYREMIALARSFTGMTAEYRNELVARVADLAEDRNPGQKIEWFRVSPPKPNAKPAPQAWLPAEPPHMPTQV